MTHGILIPLQYIFNKSKKEDPHYGITIRYFCSILGKKPRVFTLKPTFIIVYVAFAHGRYGDGVKEKEDKQRRENNYFKICSSKYV